MIPLFLCSCTDNGLLLRSNGSYPEQEDRVIYLVGDSYEIQGETFTPTEDYTYLEEGFAGWYEYDKNHPITQNGETYQKGVLTGMHRTLPLPSIVKVTNLENNEAVIVRVNERGPMVKNRIIDVSKEAADILKLKKDQSTKVLVEIMAPESQALKKELLRKEAMDAIKNTKISLEPLEPIQKPQEQVVKTESAEVVYNGQENKKTTGYVIQLGAFRNEKRAVELKNALKDFNAFIIQKKVNNQLLNCVQIDGLKTKKEAVISLDKLKASGYPEARIMTK